MSNSNELLYYLHEAKIFEIREKLQKEGFEVRTNVKDGSYQFDIVAEKGNGDKVFIEVKSGNISKERASQISKMSSFVKEKYNARFELVVANPPKQKGIVINGLGHDLLKYFTNNIPNERGELITYAEN